MKEIGLYGGKKVLVDDVDFVFLSNFHWSLQRISKSTLEYAITIIAGKPVLMHRMIMLKSRDTKHQFVDHKNGNGLDNQRSNLRLCSHAENMMNRKKHKNNTSGFVGVYWDNAKEKWVAQVRKDNKNYRRAFADVIVAKDWRNKMAQQLHGDFFVPTFGRQT